MKRCFELALKGSGNVSPNPLVGAVIVKNEKIISEGWHDKFGGAHAEAAAVRNSKVNLTGSTLYCNLEPCCHTDKKTPPCVPLIIQEGIKEVIICNIDPNPKVAGKGIKQLVEAGIKVSTGILEDEGIEINKFYFKFIRTGLPYVTLKIAQTIDGKITSAVGKQTWITGEESAVYVHRLRSIYDAVLAGANTINADDPKFTVRKTEGRNPKKIIIDGALSINENAGVLQDSMKLETIIFCGSQTAQRKVNRLSKRSISLIKMETEKNRIELNHILKKIGEMNISSILVEGGADIFSQFISSSLFDELDIIIAPVIFGKGLDSFKSPQMPQTAVKAQNFLGNDYHIILTR